jgi:two-component system response regulator NreC
MLPFLRLASVPDPEPESESEPEVSATGAIRILLADDHAAMRRSLRVLLDGESDLDVVAETDSLDSVMRYVHARHPHVLVLDLEMPNHDAGIKTLTRLHTETLATHIVVITMSDDPTFAKRALDSGADGLVLKDMADSDLPAAVREASRGKRYVSASLADKLNDAAGKGGHDRLTPREREVLRLIALGYTSVEIAEELGLSPRTIETHRARIHRKLGLGKRSELVHYALQNNMLRL